MILELEADVVAEPNKIHMLWLLPQYIVLTAGEVLFSITSLSFSFTQVRKNIFTCGHAGHNMVRVVVVVVVLVGTILKFLSFWPLEGAKFIWQQYLNKMGLIE